MFSISVRRCNAVVQVGHRSELGEFHESERPCHGGVHTERRRYHPQRDVRARRHPQQVVQLVEHHRRATHRGAKHELVNVKGEPGSGRARAADPAPGPLPGTLRERRNVQRASTALAGQQPQSLTQLPAAYRGLTIPHGNLPPPNTPGLSEEVIACLRDNHTISAFGAFRLPGGDLLPLGLPRLPGLAAGPPCAARHVPGLAGRTFRMHLRDVLVGDGDDVAVVSPPPGRFWLRRDPRSDRGASRTPPDRRRRWRTRRSSAGR
jgi:hypothetical protein